MRAVVARAHGGPQELVARELDDPTPGPGQVRLRTYRTSVNFSDIKARRGGYRGIAAPFVPGLDAAGTVEVVGPGVSGFAVGQRVAAYTDGGSYAERVLADATVCYPLPDDVDLVEGAGIGVFITAYNVLTLAGRLEPGESVLVHAGAGGVGSSAIQIARALGAGRVVATVGSEAKRSVALELGADDVIDYRRDDFAVAVETLTAGVGVDLILDSVAGPTAEAGMRCLAPFGRLVVFGHSGDGAGRFDTQQLHTQNRAVLGYSSRGYRQHRPEVLRRSAEAALELIRQGRLRLLVGAEFPLAEAAAAHELVESRRSVGKVLLVP